MLKMSVEFFHHKVLYQGVMPIMVKSKCFIFHVDIRWLKDCKYSCVLMPCIHSEEVPLYTF
jgi:hypothetical protein